MNSDENKVTYEKVLGNPGFLRCQQPECKDEQGIPAAEVYAHAWEKHKTNVVSIKNTGKS